LKVTLSIFPLLGLLLAQIQTVVTVRFAIEDDEISSEKMMPINPNDHRINRYYTLD